MDNLTLSTNQDTIENKIYTIRNMQVMLDEDLASLYGVESKRLNEQVKRNLERFPENFRFQLTHEEYENLRSQFVTSSLVSQNTTPNHGGRRYLPFVFTEQRLSLHDDKFNAYLFVSDIIKSAKKSIKLIDNYIDESTLVLFTKRDENIDMKIYTKTISKQLKLDLEKHNAQYPNIDIIKFNLSHDRFLIIDDQELYHFGASIKDLGKKWFAVSKMDINTFDILKKLK
ncbi:MAG: ORF6N domain-containing protein [Campylobacteraceae bacterium]|nr:ORF6N domain-containing protein [Campylobacteraceae bacterium]